MRDVVGAIRERGAELYVIGSGSVEQAADLKRERGLPFQLLVDPMLAGFRAAGLRRDVAASLSPRVFVNALRAFGRGHRQGRTQGDPWQQGGAFVIAPGGTTVFSQVSEVAGDHVDPQDLLRSLDALVEPAAGGHAERAHSEK